MTSSTLILPIRFVPTGHEARVTAVCEAWRDTPYVHGACEIGRGVDCIHFGAAVLDSLYGSTYSKNLKSLPPDACIHNRKGVESAMRALLQTYEVSRVGDETVEAGDLLVLGPSGASASHLMICADAGRLWHATYPRVICSGFGIPSSERLVGIFRAHDKDRWRNVGI